MIRFDGRDEKFSKTTADPRLPPPVLGRDGQITFPPTGFRGQAASAPSAQHGRMQFVSADNRAQTAERGAPDDRVSVQIDDRTDRTSRQDTSQPPTPRTPSAPQTPRTPNTLTAPLDAAGAMHWNNNVEPDAGGSPPPDANGTQSSVDVSDDAASFAPGMDDDAAGFAPGAEYAAPVSYATASSGYGGDNYAPAFPQVPALAAATWRACSGRCR
jgi:hypothetical protein